MTDTGGFQLPSTKRRCVWYSFVCVLVAMLVATPVAAMGSAQFTTASGELPAEPAFIVALDADGSAQVSVTITFNLTTDREQEAFAAFRENATAREQRTNQFATRMRAIAANAENATGRPMQIRDPAIAFATRDETGIVGLSVTWDGLAAQDRDRLVLREPFASGFSVDRRVTIVGPDGYELQAVTPSPQTQDQATVTWRAGTDFDGFEASFTPATAGSKTADTNEDGTGIGAPGFGVGVGVVALLSGAVLLRNRNQSKF